MKNRREFLQHSAKIAGGLVAGASILGANSLFAETSKNSQYGLQGVNSLKNEANSAQNSQNQDSQGEKMQNQVWYITGASGGLGLALAKYLLERGDKVAATSRKLGNIKAKLGEESENFLPLELSFEKNLQKQIVANLQAVQKKFNRLDNVVNNAGYGLLGFVEEVSEKQLREQFEVNVFAPFLVAKESLKIMRPQALKEGGNADNIKARIFNLSSIGGFRVSNASTPYCMSKFAISALSEGLNLDANEFGIHTINVMPAGFRTEFLGASLQKSALQVSAYDKRREEFLKNMANYSGKQAGNPQKFAEICYQISRDKNPPQYLFMGEAAFKSAENKIKAVQKDMKATQSYAAAAADFKDAGNSVFDKR